MSNGAAKKSKLMKKLTTRCLKLLHFAVSVALFVTCWEVFYYTRYTAAEHRHANLVLYTLYAVIIFLLYRTYDSYSLGFRKAFDNAYSQSLSQIISNGIMWIVSLLMYMRWTNPLPLIGLCVVQLAVNIAWSVIANKVYESLHTHKRTVVIYGEDNDIQRLEEIGRHENRFNIQKYIKSPSDYKALEKEIAGYEAIIVSGVDATLRNGIVKYCIDTGIPCYFAPHVGDIIIQGARHVRSLSVPILTVSRAEPAPEYLFLKRTFDIIVSAIGLIVLSPFIGITALAVKLYDHGPVLYKQVRLTRDGKEFKILKFRSMRVDAEKDGVARLSTGDNDDRITPIGKIIRACRADELPQLWNILRGDMSIVGPRPERPEIAAQYEKEMPAFGLRLQVKAGLTGYAQVYGKYNTNPHDKLEMDLMYINKMGVVEDLRLMFATVRVLFMKESTEGVKEGNTTAMKEV